MVSSCKNELLSNEFATKVIHDLITPTQAQINALELFLASSSCKLSQEEVELIELTLNSCYYMQNLVETYLTVTNLKNKKLTLNYHKFDIVDLTFQIQKSFNILFKYHGLNCTINAPKELTVNADRTQIKKTIENILSNCICHAFKNSIITVDISQQKNKAILLIKTHSHYIEPDIMEEIFNKIILSSSLYSKISYSLGLYFSREIIKAHYGRIIAKSYPENINIFGFELPL